MDLLELTSYNQLRNAFVNQFDPNHDHIENDYGDLKAEGVYTLKCGPESVFSFPYEETERGPTMLTHQGVQVRNLRDDTAEWTAFDGIDDWAAARPSVANKFDTNALVAVEAGEKTLYYVGRGTVMPERIWKQMKGTGGTIPRVFPPVDVANVHWLDTVTEDSLESLQERVADDYQTNHDGLVVVTG